MRWPFIFAARPARAARVELIISIIAWTGHLDVGAASDEALLWSAGRCEFSSVFDGG